MSGGELEARHELAEAVAASGLIPDGSSGIVLLSGGPDSVALLTGLATVRPALELVALHLNYGLRDESHEDEAVAAEVCRRLGVELEVVSPGVPEGNLQAWARERRYQAADELLRRRAADWIAVGHTMSDVAETVIYRLASSPGRRALAAMRPRHGQVVRPLLGLDRKLTRALVKEAGLPFADDRSNEDPAFARARIRAEVIPVLNEINPAAEANAALTRSELLEEGDLLDELASELVWLAGGETGWLETAVLAGRHPALRRLALRCFAEGHLGRQVPLSIARTAEAMRIAATPEGGSLDLGEGDRLVFEAGRIGVLGEGGKPAEAPPELTLPVPGTVTWAGWIVSAEPCEPSLPPGDGADAIVDADTLESGLTVRGRQPGDRIQPLGMEGSKSLQDLFTDARVPRSERNSRPVLLCGGQVVWVAGFPPAEPFKLRPSTGRAVRLSAVRG